MTDEKEGRWVTVRGSHLFIRKGQSITDAMRESGKFKKSEIEKKDKAPGKIKMTPEEKIASVHIDFDKDNILPELNESELAKVGAKENKPIRIKKSIIDRNKFYHEDAMINTDKILGETLYSPSEIFPGKSDKDYFTFVKPLRLSKRNGKDEYGVVLLDVTNTNKNFDVVHWHWVNIENLNSLKPNKKD